MAHLSSQDSDILTNLQSEYKTTMLKFGLMQDVTYQNFHTSHFCKVPTLNGLSMKYSLDKVDV